MNNHIIKQQINSLLETLAEQNEVIKNREDKIPQIELDILLQNTRNLYEAILHLNKINNAEPVKINYAVAEESLPAAAPPPTPEVINEPVVLPKEEPVMNKQEVEPRIMEERAQVISKAARPMQKSGSLFEEVPVVANKFEVKTTVHDKISKTKEDTSWHEKLQSQPVVDLKKSIGINEKFKFMNELFDGSLSDYTQSIDVLNKFSTLSEVENFIDETLLPKHKWDKNSLIYQSFTGLIKRKFST